MYLGADHPKEKDCKTFTIPAFNGLAQVLVQSGEKPSAIVLRCQGEKLQTGSVSMSTCARK
jgi:beta-galactosidase